MSNNQDNQQKGFSFTYSASEQEEIMRIRQKYAPKQPDKMERLRELDRSVTQKGSAAALIAGVIGTLVLGVGMSCCLVWMDRWFIPGILIGIIGIAAITAAYPIYRYVTQKEREKVAPEIMRLTDELMK